MMKPLLSALAVALGLVAGAAQAQSQGVSKNEIVLGSIQDLSGPLAGFGKQVRQGMLLRVDEANEQGGINGRKIKLMVEDSGLRPEEGRAGGAEAGQPGQDLRHGRTHRHARRTTPRCRCSSRRTSSTSSR